MDTGSGNKNDKVMIVTVLKLLFEWLMLIAVLKERIASYVRVISPVFHWALLLRLISYACTSGT